MTNERPLLINWVGSKDTFSGYIRGAFEHECRRYPEFRKVARGSIIGVEGLLYNLGHSGRGLEDFPKQFNLDVPVTGEQRVPYREELNIVSEAPYPKVFDQITSLVERYAVEVYRKRSGVFTPKADALQAELDILRALSAQLENRLVKITFVPFIGDFDVKRIESDGVMFESPF